MKKTDDVLKFALIGVIMYGLIINFKIINKEIIYSLQMWAKILVPSLFPYLVISKFIVQNGLPSFFSPIKKLISKLFNISHSSSEVFLCSLLCGYPCGGICASDIYKKGLIEKKEAQRLICFTNGASPVFLICAVGGVMMKSAELGILMYAVQTISSMTLGFILGLADEKVAFSKKDKNISVNSSSLTECCEKSVTTIVNIAGYIIITTAAGEIVLHLISPFFAYSPHIKYVIYYFLEISKAMKLLSANGNNHIIFALMCACASFGGLSVIMQIFGVIDKPLRTYKIVVARIFGAVLSFILGFAAINFEKLTLPHINPHVPLIISLILSVIIFIFFITKTKKQTIL